MIRAREPGRAAGAPAPALRDAREPNAARDREVVGGWDVGSDEEEALEALLALHRRIDEAAADLTTRQAGRLRCTRGCSGCCLDELSVRPIEAERIRRRQATLLRDGRPHPPGACAFLDAIGACRIYEDRPSVCRSQGLPLRVFFEDERGEIVEHRDICPLNLEAGPPLDQLREEDCWLVGPHELQLAAIDARFVAATSLASADEDGTDEEARVPLRSLFRQAPDGGGEVGSGGSPGHRL